MYLKFILESNSNKELDLLSEEIIKVAKQSGIVKAGPIPFKGKRIIFLYNPTGKLLDRLGFLKPSKKVSIDVIQLDTSARVKSYERK